MNLKDKKEIYKKTGGRCHFCARRVKLTAKSGEYGRWQVDHILPKKHGGANLLSNYLPICKRCNRLRWFLDPKRMKKTFLYGYIAYREVQKKTELGRQLHLLYLEKKATNKKHRRQRP